MQHPSTPNILTGGSGADRERYSQAGAPLPQGVHSELIVPVPGAPSSFPLRACRLPPDLTQILLGMLGRGLQEEGLQGGDPLWLAVRQLTDLAPQVLLVPVVP